MVVDFPSPGSEDVTTIELRAIAGATLPLVDKSYKADAAAGAITPGLTSSNTDVNAKNTVNYIYKFVAAIVLTPLIYAARRGLDAYLGSELSEAIKEHAALQ